MTNGDFSYCSTSTIWINAPLVLTHLHVWYLIVSQHSWLKVTCHIGEKRLDWDTSTDLQPRWSPEHLQESFWIMELDINYSSAFHTSSVLIFIYSFMHLCVVPSCPCHCNSHTDLINFVFLSLIQSDSFVFSSKWSKQLRLCLTGDSSLKIISWSWHKYP